MSFVTEKLGWGSLRRHRDSVAIHLVWQWKIPVQVPRKLFVFQIWSDFSAIPQEKSAFNFFKHADTVNSAWK